MHLGQGLAVPFGVLAQARWRLVLGAAVQADKKSPICEDRARKAPPKEETEGV